MLISVHTPKTGGSSFETFLKNHFGDQFQEDYIENPLFSESFELYSHNAILFNLDLDQKNRENYRSRNIQCIHGHFIAHKYSNFLQDPNTKYVTWFREPAERLASHYKYWLRANKNRITTPLHHKVIEENWSFKKFCLSEAMRNVYSKYLWNFSVEQFDFIGIHEYYNQDVSYFAQHFLNISDFEIPIVNVNPNKKGNYSDEIDFLEELKSFHEDDYRLYDYALRKRMERGELEIGNRKGKVS